MLQPTSCFFIFLLVQCWPSFLRGVLLVLETEFCLWFYGNVALAFELWGDAILELVSYANYQLY